MTRTIRRAAVTAALIAAPMLTFAGPAFAASAAPVTTVAAAKPAQPQTQTGSNRSRKPAPRPTKPTTPATTPSATPPTIQPAAPVDIETQVVTLTNAERVKVGCGALRIDSRLVASARAHSSDMVTRHFFSHTGSDGSDFVVREARAGYTTGASAENIAWGYRTPQEVVTGWMNSAGHRANIVNCASVAVGVGVAYAADGAIYWTQNFGRI